MVKTLIPMPVLRKDQEATELEARIFRDLQRYLLIAPPPRVTFFMNNIHAHARRLGKLMPQKEPPHD